MNTEVLARRMRDELVRAGSLEHMIGEHRLPTYHAFRRWNVERQSREHRDWCAEIGARFDRMWVDQAARRTWKTSSWLVTGVEECIRFYLQHGRGAHGMIAIPVAKKIGGVLVPNIKKIFRDMPKGYAPEHRGSGQGEHEHLYVPAVDGRIKLVGLDHHPDALRGPFLDWAFITEAGYVTTDLEGTVVSEIMLQFQGLDHAWIALESSAPKSVDHPFRRVFVVDAMARGAYSEQVITDNTSLTKEEIEDEIRMTGGMQSAVTKRELFNIVDPDPEQMVVPEFNESIHVVDSWPMPEHALCHEGYDPGTTDPHGLVGIMLDWMTQTIVIVFSWKKPNASTDEVVRTAQGFERELWGTEHATPDTRRPNTGLISIAGAERRGAGKVWSPPPGALTYWDPNGWTLKPNPFSRISDVKNQFVIDMNVDHAMSVRNAEKEPGSAEADEQHLRMLFNARHPDGRPKIVILRNGHTEDIIMQLRSGMWKVDETGHKTDWQRTKLLGHLDCIAALKYVVRDVKWRRNPYPPEAIDVNAPNTWVPERLKKQMRGSSVQIPAVRAMGGRTPWRPR